VPSTIEMDVELPLEIPALRAISPMSRRRSLAPGMPRQRPHDLPAFGPVRGAASSWTLRMATAGGSVGASALSGAGMAVALPFEPGRREHETIASPEGEDLVSDYGLQFSGKPGSVKDPSLTRKT
jgi:hypothetical protein